MSLMAVVVLATTMGSLAVAQQATDKAPTRSEAGHASATHLTVNGCIAGAQDRYSLMQTGTEAVFRLQGDTSQFEQARGKLVEVTGSELPPSVDEGRKSLPPMQVVKLRVLSAKCPIQTALRRRPARPSNQIQANPSTGSTPE